MSALDGHGNPFPGLRPFEREQSHLFFGREGQSDELLRRLRENRFLAVVGTSGSGKSSLVRAGLIALLHRGVMRSAGTGWRIATFRPGDNPIGALAQALSSPEVLGPRESDGLDAMRIEAVLRRGERGLVEAVAEARLPADDNLLVVVDQFEEIFRFQRAAAVQAQFREDAAAFVKLLLAATMRRDGQIYAVLTMRSDYLGDCAQFRELPEAINRGQYLIPRMTREERRLAITGPVRVAQGEIAPRLVTRLLNDAGDDPGQLPILQHALMRTWDHWKGRVAEEAPLDLEDYEAIGGMAEALSRHAGEAYDQLESPRSRAIAERMFKRLTEKGSDNREVRRPTKVSELCAVAEATEPEIVAVIEAFRRSDRAFLTPSAPAQLGPEIPVDISHESLIRGWRQLKGWVDQEADAGETYRDLSRTAARHARGDAELLHGLDLQVKQRWWKDTRPNQAWAQAYDTRFAEVEAFLEASSAQARRQRSQRQQLRQGVIAVSAMVFLFVCYSWYSAARSERHAKQATEMARQAAQRTRLADLAHYAELGSIADLGVSLGGSLGARVAKASALSYVGRHDSAVAEYTRSLKVDPTYWYGRINRCDEYLNVGQADSARQDCSAVVAMNSRSYIVHLNLAVAWGMLGRYDSARSAFETAIRSTRFQTLDGMQSIVSPTIIRTTGRTSLSVRGREIPAALYYGRVGALAALGSPQFVGALAEADAQPRWSSDPLLNALNWIWLQYKANDTLPAGYGAFAAEGALWERSGFEEEARASYARFQRDYANNPDARYADLVRWVGRRVWYLRLPAFLRARPAPARDAGDVTDLELRAQENQAAARPDSAVAKLDSALWAARSDSSLYLDLLLERAAAEVDALQAHLLPLERLRSTADSIIARDSSLAIGYYYRALAQWWAGRRTDHQTILADLDRDLERNPTDVGGLWISYWMLVDSAPKVALERLERVSHVDPGEPQLFFQMAKTQNWIAEHEKDARQQAILYGRAGRFIGMALALKRDDLSYYDERATAEAGMGKPRDQVRHNWLEGYRRAAEIRERQGDRDNALKAHLRREQLARGTREAREVESDVQRRIQEFVDGGLGWDRVHYVKAQLLSEDERYSAALREIEQAIKLEPDTSYYELRAAIEHRLGRAAAD